MERLYKLLLPTFLLIIMLIGSVSAPLPEIPPPPYNPESPEEDIIKVEAYMEKPTATTTKTVAQSLKTINGVPMLHLKITFAAATPPPGKVLNILITHLEGTPPSEIAVALLECIGPAKTTYEHIFGGSMFDEELTNIAVYAWLDDAGTDRAPNTDFYQITSLSASDPNMFQDYDPAPVAGVVVPKNSFEILTPYIALAGLFAVISTAYVIKKRK